MPKNDRQLNEIMKPADANLWDEAYDLAAEALAVKVDAVAGKGLSTNDYTTAEKTKLGSVESNANKYSHPTYTTAAAGPTTDATLLDGGTFIVPSITRDSTGHVSSVANRTITLPVTGYTHPSFTEANAGSSTNASLVYGGTLTVPYIIRDTNGHVSTLENRVMTLPAAPTSVATLTTARYFSLTGGATGTATAFNGSANVAINVTALNVSTATAGTLPITRGGTGATTASAALTALGASASNHTHSDYVYRDDDEVSIGEFSSGGALAYHNVTIGYNAKADWAWAVSIGEGSGAMANGTIAIGRSSKAGGDFAVAVGGVSNSSGYYSTAVGPSTKALASYATAIGSGANASATNSTAIGPQANASANNSTAIGQYAICSVVNGMQLGNATSLASLSSKVSLTVTSDSRDKADFEKVDNGLKFINKLNPVTYVFNGRDLYNEELSEEDLEIRNKYGIYKYDKDNHDKGTKKGKRRRAGLEAQKVIEALKDVYGDSDYANIVNDNLHDENGDLPDGVENRYSMSYETLVPFLISAVQELSNQVEGLKEQLNG